MHVLFRFKGSKGLTQQIYLGLTLKHAGGGRIVPIGQEIACHFLQDHTMGDPYYGHKNSWLYP